MKGTIPAKDLDKNEGTKKTKMTIPNAQSYFFKWKIWMMKHQGCLRALQRSITVIGIEGSTTLAHSHQVLVKLDALSEPAHLLSCMEF